jgi:VCBS repeat-containing protein
MGVRMAVAVLAIGAALCAWDARGGVPAPWLETDIGTVTNGTGSEAAGTFTLTAQSGDIWGTTDNFHYVYQQVSGNQTITARIVSMTNTGEWAKAGVMFRDALTADSAHVMAISTPPGANPMQMQWRDVAGGNSGNSGDFGAFASYWVRLVRSGNSFFSYVSADGVTWALTYSHTTVMPDPVFVGLMVTSNNGGATCTAEFDNVTLAAGPPGLPGGWTSADVGTAGNPALPGMSSESGGTWTVIGSGSDIWDLDDHFQYAYRQYTGDFDMIVRFVGYTDGTDGWRKYGIMARDSLAAGSPCAFMGWAPNAGGTFQYRTTTGGVSASTTYGAGTPKYLRLIRRGSSFCGYVWDAQDVPAPGEGNWWRMVGQQAITMGATIYLGLGATAHNNGQLTIGTFDSMQLTTPGATGLLGEYYDNNDLTGFLFNRFDGPVAYKWPDNWAADPVMAGDNWSIRWRGVVVPQYTETYTFYTSTDDGVRLWVNGTQMVNQWVGRGAPAFPGDVGNPTINMVAGQKYDIVMEYYEGGGGCSARLAWSSPSQPAQIIPFDRLLPVPVPPTIAPNGGAFGAPVLVTLATPSATAQIRYTTDGTDPNGSSTLYTGPFWMFTSNVVKALASFSGGPLGEIVTSAPFVINDVTAPTIVSATAANTSDVRVTFSEPVTPATAQNVNNYSINNGVGTPVQAVLEPSLLSVILSTNSTFSGGTTYTLTVNNIQDYATNTIAANSTATFSLTGTGLRGEYYNLPGGQTYPPPVVPAGTLALTRVDGPVDFDWGNGSLGAGVNADNVITIWRGCVMAESTGSYTFTTVTDDGARLYVNGSLINDHWVDQGPTAWTSSPVTFTAGQLYDVRMEYYERGGGAVARLQWTRPGFGAPVAVPQSQLFPAVVPPTITPNAGSFTDTIIVTMAAVTQGATIRYTLDGSVPTAASTLYTGPFPLSSSAVVKARAFCAGLDDSGVATANLTVNDTTRPTITICDAYVANQVTVMFSEPLNPASATNTANYSIDGGIGVPTLATLSSDATTVTLNVGAPLVAGQTYTLTVNNVADTAPAPNTVLPNTQRVFSYVTFPVANLEMLLRMDEGVGGAALDSTANAHNGALTNGPRWVPGYMGYALSFDGTNDSVIVPDHLNLRYGSLSNFSLSAWVYVPAVPLSSAVQAIMSKSREAPADYGISATSSFGWGFTGAAGNQWSNGAVAAGWHQITAVQDAAAAQRHIYVDGVLRDAGAVAAQFGDGTGAFWVGGANGTTEYFNGVIDDVRVYNGALTLAEIGVLANRAPVVNAGPDQQINIPPGQATLAGTVTDDNLTGAPTPTWVAVSGPGAVGFAPSANVLNPTVTVGAFGVYVLRLVANDGQRCASDDAYGTNEDTALNVGAPGVLGNDTDGNGDPLTAALVAGPANAAAFTFNPDGSFSYTPNVDWNGADTFTYQVTDGMSTSNTATVTITVAAVNDAPVGANPGAQTGTEDTAATIVVTGIAPGPATATDEIAAQTVTPSVAASIPAMFSSLTIGPVAAGQATISYTPALDVTGPVDLTVTLDDGQGPPNNQTLITFTLTINPVNDPPTIANPGAQTGTEDTPWTVALTGIGPGGGADEAVQVVTVTATSSDQTIIADANLSVVGAGANRTLNYTPEPNAWGIVTITVTADDGQAVNNTTQISFTLDVASVNDAPVANDDAYTMVATRTYTIAAPGVLGNDTDVEITRNEVPLQTLAADRTALPAVPGLTAFNADGSFTFVAPATAQVVTFQYRAIDDGVPPQQSNLATVTITVIDNAVPVAQDGVLTVDEDTAGNGTLVATDGDADPLTYQLLVNGTLGTAVITNTATGAYTYTPNLNANGIDTFTFQAWDGYAWSNIATITVTINPVNDAPVAANGALAVVEDTPANGTLSADDGDPELNQALTYSIVANGVLGTAVITNAATGAYTYTPNLNANGMDSFTFQVNDGGLDSNVATVTVTISPVNDTPASASQSVTVIEDTPTTIALNVSDADPEVTQALTLNVVTAPAHGALSGFNAQTGEVLYTPALNYFGADSFTYTVTDDASAGPAANLTCPQATVTITVAPVNDAPVALAQTVSVGFNLPAAVALAATDVDSASLTYAVTSQPAHGALSGTAPLLTYTPNLNFVGTDAFTFTASDGLLTSAAATVTLIVTGPPSFDSPPVITPEPVVAGQPVLAQASAGQSTVTWNFGDGTAPATGTSVSHIFAQPGIYTVTVTATTAAGAPTSTQLQVFVGLPLGGSSPTGTSGGAGLPQGASGIVVGSGSSADGTGKVVCNYLRRERTLVYGALTGISFPTGLTQAQLAGQTGVLTLGRGATAQTFMFTLSSAGRGRATSLPMLEVSLKKQRFRFKANNRPALTAMIEAQGGTWLRDTYRGPVTMVNVPASLQVGNTIFLAITFRMEYRQVGDVGKGGTQ